MREPARSRCLFPLGPALISALDRFDDQVTALLATELLDTGIDVCITSFRGGGRCNRLSCGRSPGERPPRRTQCDGSACCRFGCSRRTVLVRLVQLEEDGKRIAGLQRHCAANHDEQLDRTASDAPQSSSGEESCGLGLPRALTDGSLEEVGRFDLKHR